MLYFGGEYDVAVIGAGHAGIEAALSAARMGMRTAIFTINMDWVGNMPCNPSIGGTAKGHLVRELDALGGEMGIAADKTILQSRMLNRGKGPAVHSLRAQIDRRAYSGYMKCVLESTENLHLRQAEITGLHQDENKLWVVTTQLGAQYKCRAVILATGTFLKGKVFVGEVNYEGGPDGTFAASSLSNDLLKLGLPLRRFKTGTPARVLRSSIDFSDLEIQLGDDRVIPFSYSTNCELHNKVVCHITYTNEKTEEVIRANLHRSPLFSGVIEGVGPRYCPSIEDKIVRFSDKKRHQVFIEPCGENTEEMYLQGMSSSLPEEVQIKLYKTIKGLENVVVMRNAYAIEYDCIDPLALTASLEIKGLNGLFGAGQFNGSSGYEEAAAQGLVAGINASRKIKSLPPMEISRQNSYIGTLIDDLVTKGCSDPYRMMTSRSEYRLVLRQDNADERLMPLGRENGLIDTATWERFLIRRQQKELEIKRLSNTFIAPSEKLAKLFEERLTVPITTGAKLIDLIRRPQLNYECLAPFDKSRPTLPIDVCENIEIEIKYAGYIERQKIQIKQQRQLENKRIDECIDYSMVAGLRLEAREKLQKIMPASIGMASRISGVTPADISVLLIHLAKSKH